MNLSPVWTTILVDAGFEAVHWSQVGNATASDKEIFDWAAERGYVVVTHDLDFGTILAHSFARGPSVIQIRAYDLSPHLLQRILIATLRNTADELEKGALVTLDLPGPRIRLLPLN